MSRPEINAALKRLDAAWLKRVMTRVDQLKAEAVADAAVAVHKAACEEASEAIDEVFAARAALQALVLPPEALPEPPEPRSFE